MNRARLRTNLFWVLAGNLVYAACQWGVVIALARLGTPQIVGDFAFALALTTPIFIFALLNLRAAQATDQRAEFAFADYVHLRILCLAGSAALVALIVLCGRFDWNTVGLVAMVALTKTFDALSDVVYGLLQQRERMRRIAISRMLQGILQLGALALTMAATGSLIAAAAAMATASLAVPLFYDLQSVRFVELLDRAQLLSGGEEVSASGRSLRVGWPPHWGTIARLSTVSLPLGIAGVLDSLSANVPRYVLDLNSGREALGYYAAISSFLLGQGTVLVAVADAARPRLARYFVTSPDDFNRLTRQLAAVATAAAVLALVVANGLGAQVLRLFYGAEYGAQQELFVWMMAAALPWNLAGVVSTALSAARRFGALSLSFLVMAVATTVASLLLVPRYGAIGAAWAFGLGMIARLGTSCAALWCLSGAVVVPDATVGVKAS